MSAALPLASEGTEAPVVQSAKGRRARSRPRASRGTFVAINAAILIVGLLSLLLINTSLAQGAFEVSALQRELQALQEEQTSLQEDIAMRSSPIALARAAERLGLVQVRRAAFLRIDDGRIIGRPRPVPYPQADGSLVGTGTGTGTGEGESARPGKGENAATRRTDADSGRR